MNSLFREEPKRGTQRWKVLDRLRRGPATSMELSEVCLRYSARIHELRERGWNIVCDHGKDFCTYRLG